MMKLINRKSDDELCCEEEGIPFEEDTYYSNLFLKHIVDVDQNIIGDLYGRFIDTKKLNKSIIYSSEGNFFIEMDAISQLCCEVAEFLLDNTSEYTHTNGIIFLNRLSLKKEFATRENEEKALMLLFNSADMVIYSFGSTELDDEFPESDHEEQYWKEYERMLLETHWTFDEEYQFYMKKKISELVLHRDLRNKNIKDDIYNTVTYVGDNPERARSMIKGHYGMWAYIEKSGVAVIDLGIDISEYHSFVLPPSLHDLKVGEEVFVQCEEGTDFYLCETKEEWKNRINRMIRSKMNERKMEQSDD